MEVHDAAGLVLGDLAVGHPQLHAVLLAELPDGAAEGDRGAAPEFAGEGVPHDVRCVVVDAGVDRLAERPGVLAVAGGAQDGAAVGGDLRVAAQVAGPDLPVARVHDPGVDGPERGRGQGGEHGRVGGDGVGDAFAADEAGADELVGVGAVGLGAPGADRGAAVAAGDVDDAVGHRPGVAGGEDGAGGGVDGVQLAGEPDGAGAAAGGGDVVEPAAVAELPGPLDDACGVDARPGRASRRG